MELTVIKRDGSREPFEKDKLQKVLVAAGLDQMEAEALTGRVIDWATIEHGGEVSSLAIRDKVLEELRTVNEAVANLFAWYQHTKDSSTASI